MASFVATNLDRTVLANCDRCGRRLEWLAGQEHQAWTWLTEHECWTAPNWIDTLMVAKSALAEDLLVNLDNFHPTGVDNTAKNVQVVSPSEQRRRECVCPTCHASPPYPLWYEEEAEYWLRTHVCAEETPRP